MKLSHTACLWRVVCAVLLYMALPLAVLAQVPAVNPAFPNNISGTPGTLLFRQIGLNRVTNIAYHNGLIYTHEVGGANPRRWRFTDINNPTTLTNELTGSTVGNFSDHGTHGHYKVGNYLGGLYDLNIMRVSDGVNSISRYPGFANFTFPVAGEDFTKMYYPWALGFNWIQYRAMPGNGYLYRGTTQIATWPALARDGVAGNCILLGNLFFVTSDESNMGVLCYDISPVFATPSGPPILLDKLSGSTGAYIASVWQNYIVFSRRDTSTVDVIDYSDPTNLRFVTAIDIRGNAAMDRGNGLGYVQCQDNFIFTQRHKINMDTFQVVLELDELGNNRPAGSITGQLDTSQHYMPMGNLLVTGGYSVSGADGVGVWIHDSTPDRRAPYVGYHIPRPGQTNFPRGAPVSLIIHENLESYTIVNGTSVILRPVGGSAVPATIAFSYDDVMTITPDSPLAADTTYEVQVVAGGIKDVAGNGIEGYSFTFSTGASVAGGNASPVINSFNGAPSPTTVGTTVTLSASANDTDSGDTLEYRFTFGEGTAVRDWSTEPTATHAYSATGHFGVKVQVRDVRGGTALSTVSRTGTISVTAATPSTSPTKSSPITLDAANRLLWVVNPDNDSVSIINADTRALVVEVPLAPLLSISGSVDPRSVAVDTAGNAWIACRDADRLVVLNSSGGLVQSISTGYGSAPMGVAIAPSGSVAFVTLEGGSQASAGAGQLVRFSTSTRGETGRLTLGPTPRAIAITVDSARVLVTRFISSEEFGQVWDVNATTMALTRTINLHRDRTMDVASGGRGVPNYVGSITITPDGLYAYYTATKANTFRGTFFDQGRDTNDPLDPDNTIRAIIGRISLVTNNEPMIETRTPYRIDVDNSDSPTALAFTGPGDYFFTTIQGNNHIAVFDDILIRALPDTAAVKTTKGRFATGLAPQGVVFDRATNRLFCADFMGRSVTVHDMSGFLSFGSFETGRTVIPTIGTEKLPAEVLLGKRIFYQSADGSGLSTLPTMSLEGYISCASCHVDGQHDGMTWDFTQRGEGLRNTTDLRGRLGTGHGNVHWTGNFDELQDFVLDVVNEFGGGEGLLPAGQTPNPGLGAPNAGRSVNLDALAAYVSSLGGTHLPRSPLRNSDGSQTAAATAGASVFVAQNCVSCHSPSALTDSTTGTATLHDVGTRRTSSGQRMGGTLTGLDTPTLLGLWATAPYYHNGSAKTLDEVFSVSGGTMLQAENATLSSGVYMPPFPRQNEDSAMHGQMVYVATGQTVTFSNVSGGTTAGAGDIELRWIPPYWGAGGNVTVTVNGTAHVRAVTRPYGNGQPGNYWQRIRIEDVALTAGTTNTIIVTTSSAQASGFDDITITTPDDRTATVAHRRVLGLTATERSNLNAYLMQLDGSMVGPAVNLALAAGQASSSATPYVEFDIGFSTPVTGLRQEDFVLGGTSGATASQLSTVIAGSQYRIRVAGFAQAGTVTVQLPASAVTDATNGMGNGVSNVASFTYAPSVGGQTFSDWLAANLTPSSLLDPVQTSMQADHNQNTRSNLQEFALGSTLQSPLSADVTDAVRVMLPRNSQARGVIIVIQASPDLATWSDIATSTDGAAFTSAFGVSESTGVVRTVTVRLPLATPHRFFRVRILGN